MALYSGTFSIAGVNAANGVLFNLKAAATDRLFVREVFFGIEVVSTNAPQYGLMRMNAVGTGAITTATAFSHDSADGTSAGSLETAWATTRPTVTGGSARRGQVPLAVGNGFLFNFWDKPLVVPLSGGICGVMMNASGATTGTHGGYVVWEE